MLEKEAKKLQEEYIVALEHVDNKTAEDLTNILKGWQIQPILRGENGPEGWILSDRKNGYELQINKFKKRVFLRPTRPTFTNGELPDISSVKTLEVNIKEGFIRFCSSSYHYQIYNNGNSHDGNTSTGEYKEINIKPDRKKWFWKI